MICWLQGEESPVRHHDGGPVAADSGQRGLDVPLRLGVQGGRGLHRRTQPRSQLACFEASSSRGRVDMFWCWYLVQQNDVRFLQDGSSDGYPLLLAAAQLQAALPDLRVVACSHTSASPPLKGRPARAGGPRRRASP